MKLSIHIDQQFDDYVKRRWLRTVVSRALTTAKAGSKVQLDLVITDDDTLHELNRRYRSIDRPTDVLAFALTEESGDRNFITPPDEPPPLGEVIVSYPTAVRQATEHSHSAEREIALLVTHGVLHLLGYDHDTEAREREMRTLEERVLKGLE